MLVGGFKDVKHLVTCYNNNKRQLFCQLIKFNKFMIHLSGKKFSKRHTTVIDAAKKIIKFLANQSLVNKISIGEIKAISNGPKRLKISNSPAGIKLMIRGSNSIQYFFIYTTEIEKAKLLINDFWKKN